MEKNESYAPSTVKAKSSPPIASLFHTPTEKDGWMQRARGYGASLSTLSPQNSVTAAVLITAAAQTYAQGKDTCTCKNLNSTDNLRSSLDCFYL